MLEIANCSKKGYLEINDIKQFPRKYLHTIDQFWLYYRVNEKMRGKKGKYS